jgi:hypothetical protein
MAPASAALVSAQPDSATSNSNSLRPPSPSTDRSLEDFRRYVHDLFPYKFNIDTIQYHSHSSIAQTAWYSTQVGALGHLHLKSTQRGRLEQGSSIFWMFVLCIDRSSSIAERRYISHPPAIAQYELQEPINCVSQGTSVLCISALAA